MLMETQREKTQTESPRETVFFHRQLIKEIVSSMVLSGHVTRTLEKSSDDDLAKINKIIAFEAVDLANQVVLCSQKLHGTSKFDRILHDVEMEQK